MTLLYIGLVYKLGRPENLARVSGGENDLYKIMMREEGLNFLDFFCFVFCVKTKNESELSMQRNE